MVTVIVIGVVAVIVAVILIEATFAVSTPCRSGSVVAVVVVVVGVTVLNKLSQHVT